jgi:hypothetical protein
VAEGVIKKTYSIEIDFYYVAAVDASVASVAGRGGRGAGCGGGGAVDAGRRSRRRCGAGGGADVKRAAKRRATQLFCLRIVWFKSLGKAPARTRFVLFCEGDPSYQAPSERTDYTETPRRRRPPPPPPPPLSFRVANPSPAAPRKTKCLRLPRVSDRRPTSIAPLRGQVSALAEGRGRAPRWGRRPRGLTGRRMSWARRGSALLFGAADGRGAAGPCRSPAPRPPCKALARRQDAVY